MKKPEVTLANYKAVYDYYEQRQLPRVGVAIGYNLLATLIHPHIHLQHEDTADHIQKLVDDGTQLVLASNHVSNMDPPVMAATAMHFRPFRPMVGNAFIPSKNPLFKNRVLRFAVDILGATPQFRTKNLTRDGQPLSDEERALRNAGLERSFAMARTKIGEQGMHMGIYPQKERVASRTIESIGFALGQILCNLDPSVNIALVPMAQYYGNSKLKLRPDVAIGSPILGPFESPAEFEPLLIANMQECLDIAHTAHSER